MKVATETAELVITSGGNVATETAELVVTSGGKGCDRNRGIGGSTGGMNSMWTAESLCGQA
ncbi:hypothetical protein [Actinobaculum suis]|uniref:hypothetical protein n=1 Tax=Actinobaculum suis TaxID=1657 RepID=UPI0012E17F8D|nr:hypothetical protein [Actinobaculum suis]